MRFPNRQRTDYFPASARRVRAKDTDAVAYIYEKGDRFFACCFGGRRQKPDSNYYYRNAKARERAVREHFEQAAVSHRYRTEQKKRDQEQQRRVEVGHILVSSWGYEQTNVNFYQVTALIGKTMIEVRPIASNPNESLTSMSGKVVPVADQFTGAAQRCRWAHGGVKISDCQRATIWNGKPVFESSWH